MLIEGGLRTKGHYKTKTNDFPLVTIITVVFNGEKYLNQTISSVVNQTYKNIEYIVIDGASNDNTLSIIKEYDEQIDYWISESDTGIYDAMNKGISAVNDKDSYILFLNADDYLYSNSVIDKFVSNIDDEDFLYGKILSMGNSINVVLGRKLSLQELPVSMIQHQATFIKKKLFDDLGMFDLSYKIAADFDFAVRVMKSPFKHKFINEIIAVMRMGGASSKVYQTTTREKMQIIGIHYKGYVKIKAVFFIKFYEIPKHFFSNLLKALGLLGLWRNLKKRIFIQST